MDREGQTGKRFGTTSGETRKIKDANSEEKNGEEEDERRKRSRDRKVTYKMARMRQGEKPARTVRTRRSGSQ